MILGLYNNDINININNEDQTNNIATNNMPERQSVTSQHLQDFSMIAMENIGELEAQVEIYQNFLATINEDDVRTDRIRTSIVELNTKIANKKNQ